jgi:hypothetical protein
MDIEKAYLSLPEVLDRWSITENDLIYLAENNNVRLSIRVFILFLELDDYDADIDGALFRVPHEQKSFGGLLDLHACDVFHLFRAGEIHLSEFRYDQCGYACLLDAQVPQYVVIGDLLLWRVERDIYEVKSGFPAGNRNAPERTFIASHGYKEVRCNGHLFQLGPTQHFWARRCSPPRASSMRCPISGVSSMKCSWSFRITDRCGQNSSVLSLTLPTCFREFRRVCRGRVVLG